jgi:hypothetical protein
MKTENFVSFFTLPIDADVKSRRIYEKKLTQYQHYFLKLMSIKFLMVNFSSNH